MPFKEVTINGAGRIETKWFDIRYHQDDNNSLSRGIYSEEFKKAAAKKAGIPFEFLTFEYFNGTDWVRRPVNRETQQHVGVRAKIAPEYVYQVENSFSVLLEDISRLMKDPDTADFVLRTKEGSKIFPVHKAILASRSTVFRAMFTTNMFIIEVSTGQAIIEDLDEGTLEEMIHFLYTGGLSGSQYDIVSLCYAANKYELDSLMNLIRLNMNSTDLDAKQLADLFIASDMFSRESLFGVAVEKLKEGMGMLEEVLEKMKDRPELIIKIFLAVK